MQKELYLIGGGTLAALIIETVNLTKEFKVIGIFDDTIAPGKDVHGVPVLGKIKDSSSDQFENFCLAVGEPKHRKNLYEHAALKDKVFPKIIHPTAYISDNSIIEQGVYIGPLSTVLTETRVNKFSCLLAHCNINQNVLIEEFVLIGASAVIGNEAIIKQGAHLSMASIVNPAAHIESWSYFKK